MTKTDSLLTFIRSHGLTATVSGGAVVFVCADGDRHSVTSIKQAREILGY